MFRVRQFTQDDGHIFVRPDQVESEINAVLELVDIIYGTFGLQYRVNLSTRPDDFMGEPELWDEAEAALKRAIEANGLEYKVKEGDGAFYGPKIDFDVLDSLGRKWQCATVQLDFQLPRAFDLTYTDSDNTPKVPIVIHRAIFGSIERFFGILLEHVSGLFPTWLAPTQAIFLPINDECAPACREAAARLRAQGLRAEVDERSEKLGFKIREAELRKVPYMLVVGKNEVADGTFSLRTYQSGDRGKIGYEALEAEMLEVVRERKFDVALKTIQWSTDEEEDVGDAHATEY